MEQRSSYRADFALDIPLNSMGAEPIVLLLAVIFLPLFAWLVYLSLRKSTRIYGVAILCAATALGAWGMVADHAVSILGFVVYFTLAAIGAGVVGLVIAGFVSLLTRWRRV